MKVLMWSVLFGLNSASALVNAVRIARDPESLGAFLLFGCCAGALALCLHELRDAR